MPGPVQGWEPQEQEQPVQLRKIRGEDEKSPECGTRLLRASHSPNLLSGKRNVLRSLYFYFPS